MKLSSDRLDRLVCTPSTKYYVVVLAVQVVVCERMVLPCSLLSPFPSFSPVTLRDEDLVGTEGATGGMSSSAPLSSTRAVPPD